MKSLQLVLVLSLVFLNACSKPSDRKKNQRLKANANSQKTIPTQPSSDRVPDLNSNSLPPITPGATSPSKGSNQNSAPVQAPVPDVDIRTQAGDDRPVPPKNTNGVNPKPQDSTPVAQPATQGQQSSQPPKPAVPESQPQKPQDANQKAQNSDEIEKQEIVKIRFKDLKALQDLEKTSNSVLYQGQILDQQAALEKLMKANEESFCKIEGSAQFHAEDFLRIQGGDRKALNEAQDIYRSELVFENSHGKLKFICTHATSNFFVEDLRTNFQKMITIFNFEGKTENAPDYMNPRTEDRLLQAIQIQDLEKFNRIIVKPDEKQNFALIKGEVYDLEQAVNTAKAQKEKMACFIHEVRGEISDKKTYVQVQLGIGEDTPSAIPTAGIFYIYLADADNGFVLYCIQAKRAPLRELFTSMKGVFKFGVLERNEFRTKRSELVRIHQEQSKEAEGKK